MFSDEFLRYLINYQPDGCEVEKQNQSTEKEIEFKTESHFTPAKVYLTINNNNL